MTATPPDPLADVWGGRWSHPADSGTGALDGALAGVLVIDGGRAARADDGQVGGGGPWPAVAAAIRRLPASATTFVWLGDLAPPPAALVAMCARLPGRDAVVVASPVSDAVKRVEGGMIVAGVDRTGLCRPRPPLLIRAMAARDRVAPALAAGHEIIAAVAVSGCTVAVMEPTELDVA